MSSADRPLYRHQVRAIELLRTGRNVIVSSGTGSGKTLAYLLPIIDVLKRRERVELKLLEKKMEEEEVRRQKIPRHKFELFPDEPVNVRQ